MGQWSLRTWKAPSTASPMTHSPCYTPASPQLGWSCLLIILSCFGPPSSHRRVGLTTGALPHNQEALGRQSSLSPHPHPPCSLKVTERSDTPENRHPERREVAASAPWLHLCIMQETVYLFSPNAMIGIACVVGLCFSPCEEGPGPARVRESPQHSSRRQGASLPA